MGRFENRRSDFLQRISLCDSDVMFLSSGFEFPRCAFRPSSFAYYLTGIEDPGVIVNLDVSGHMEAYIPRYGADRGLWCGGRTIEDPWWKQNGFSAVHYLGEEISGYSLSLPIAEGSVANFLQVLKDARKILTVGNSQRVVENEQCIFLSQVSLLKPELREKFVDVSDFLSEMRRVKDEDEVVLLKRAVDATVAGQYAAARAVKPGLTECAVRGDIEREFLLHGSCRCSFPSIVATGKNATVLHHTSGQRAFADGDLVVVDVGAEFGFYAGDITRTYPVSGRFSERQRELYQVVLDAQLAAEQAAKPGMSLKNVKEPSKSIYNIACDVLASRGLERYFLHGVGHYLGLDVHDVGDICKPLESGCVFTIEPGVYIPEEGIGIRIEDDYLMTGSGAVRLSDSLPREIHDIEKIMNS